MGKTAFDAKRGNVFFFDPEDLVLVEKKDHPLYQERVHLPVSEQLVLSMKVRGFRSTIAVRRDGDRAEVVNGRQRVKAAREANKQLLAEGKQPIKVRAFLEKGDDVDLFGVMVLSNHGDQKDDPMEEARELQRFLSMGRSHAEAAAIFCKPISWVQQALSLFDAAPAVQKAVTSGQVSVTAASKLAKFSRDGQVERLDSLLKATGGKKVTVSQVKRAAATTSGAATAPSKKEIKAALEAVTGKHLSEESVLRWVLTGGGDFEKWLSKNRPRKVTTEPVEDAP